MRPMAATGTRPPVFAPGRATAPAADRLRGVASGPAVLGIAIAAALVYAAFASGATGHPEEGRLEIGVIVISLGALAGLLYRRSLRFAPSPGAAAGLMLLLGLAAWSALSITWSIAPDDSWLEANRVLAYALVVALGLCLGSSLPGAVEKVALGWVAIALLVAFYALAGKIAPWLEIPGIVDFDQTSRFSRLRAPLDYWNALGMVCVLAVPIALRAAADPWLESRWRLAALAAAIPLLTTLALTLSRGGMLVLLAAVLLLVAIGPDRLRLVAATGIALAGTIPAAALAIASNDLTDEGVKVSERADDGTFVGLALVAGIALALALGRRLVDDGDRLQLGPRGAARLKRAGRVAAIAIPLVALAALSTSDKGVRGAIDDRLDSFTEPKFDRQNDPARVLQTNSGNRWIWWEEAAGAASDRPFVGNGAGSFRLLHLVYRENEIEVQNAHSMPLEQWAETGLIGVVLALGALGLLGLAAVRTTLARAHGRERGLALGMLAAVFAWWLHLWVDWDWEIAGVTLPVLVMLGVLGALPRAGGVQAPPGPPVPGRGLVFAVGAVAACAAITLVALPMLARDLTSEALTQAASNTPGDLRAAAEKAGRAKRLNPLAPEPLFAQASIYEHGNQPVAAGNALAEAVERQPNDPGVWLRLVRFQLLLDDSAGARRSLVAVSGLNPLAAFKILNFEFLLYDERRSASASGTPLPEKLRGPEPARGARRPTRGTARRGRARRPADSRPAPGSPSPTRPSPSPSPSPTPAPQRPAPRPQPAPEPEPGGDPFRLEG
jgi:O-antigen ligase